MKPWLVIRSGMTASAVAHLSVLMLVLFFSEVHPFGSVTAEPIAVDIVTPAEARRPRSRRAETEAEAPRQLRLHNYTGEP